MSQKKTYENVAKKVSDILDVTQISEKNIVSQLPEQERQIYLAGPLGIPEKRTQNRSTVISQPTSFDDIDEIVFKKYKLYKPNETKDNFLQTVSKTVSDFLKYRKAKPTGTYENYIEVMIPYKSIQIITTAIKPSVMIRLGERVDFQETQKPVSKPVIPVSKPVIPVFKPVVPVPSSKSLSAVEPQPKSAYVSVPKEQKPKGFFSGLMSFLPFSKKDEEEDELQEEKEKPKKPVVQAVAKPVSRPVTTHPPIEGFCPIRNPNNWCYLNATIQLLNDIPELKEGFISLTPEQIREVEINLITEQSKEKVLQILTLLHSLFSVIETTNPNTILDLKTKKVPNGKSIYTEFIDFLLTEREKPLNEARKPFYVYGDHIVKQSDADEAFIRILNGIFSANLDFLMKLRYMFTFQEVGIINCEDKTIGKNGYLEATGSPFSTTLDLTLHKLNEFGQPTEWVSSLQQGVNNQQALEILTNTENRIESCGKGGKTGKVLTKGFKFIVFPFTKYLFIKIRRLEEDTYYKGKIEINKTLIIDGIAFQPRGVIHHSGALIKGTGKTSGHYTYYHFENGIPTILCNDDKVSKITDVNAAWNAVNSGGRAVLYERKTPIDPTKLNAAVQHERKLYGKNKEIFVKIRGIVDTAKKLRNGNEGKVDKQISRITSIPVLEGIEKMTKNQSVKNYAKKQLNYLRKDKVKIAIQTKINNNYKAGIHELREEEDNNNNVNEELANYILGTQSANSNTESNTSSTIALETMNGGKKKRSTRKKKSVAKKRRTRRHSH
jgi:hypothetical protein